MPDQPNFTKSTWSFLISTPGHPFDKEKTKAEVEAQLGPNRAELVQGVVANLAKLANPTEKKGTFIVRFDGSAAMVDMRMEAVKRGTGDWDVDHARLIDFSNGHYASTFHVDENKTVSDAPLTKIICSSGALYRSPSYEFKSTVQVLPVPLAFSGAPTSLIYDPKSSVWLGDRRIYERTVAPSESYPTERFERLTEEGDRPVLFEAGSVHGGKKSTEICEFLEYRSAGNTPMPHRIVYRVLAPDGSPTMKLEFRLESVETGNPQGEDISMLGLVGNNVSDARFGKQGAHYIVGSKLLSDEDVKLIIGGEQSDHPSPKTDQFSAGFTTGLTAFIVGALLWRRYGV